MIFKVYKDYVLFKKERKETNYEIKKRKVKSRNCYRYSYIELY